MVDGLKGEDLKESVALWGYPSEESYLSHVRVTHATPRPVKNGAERRRNLDRPAGDRLRRF